MSSTPSSRTAGRGESRGEGSGEGVRVMEIEREHGAERGGMDVEEVDMGLSPVGSVGGEVVGSQRGHSAATAKVWCPWGGCQAHVKHLDSHIAQQHLGVGVQALEDPASASAIEYLTQAGKTICWGGGTNNKKSVTVRSSQCGCCVHLRGGSSVVPAFTPAVVPSEVPLAAVEVLPDYSISVHYPNMGEWLGPLRRVPVVEDIPSFEGCAASFASILVEIFGSIAGGAEDWVREGCFRLMVVAPCILRSPARALNLRVKQKGWRRRSLNSEIAKVLQERMDQWNSGPEGILRLFEETLREARSANCDTSSTRDQRLSNRSKATKLAKVGEFSKMIQSLLSNGTLKLTPEVRDALLVLHPQEEPTPASEGPSVGTSAQLNLESLDLLETTLRSFKKTTSPGLDRMHIGHLLAGLGTRVPAVRAKYLRSLGAAVNKFLAGTLPKDLSKFFAAARLIPLRKKSSPLPRPIAIGTIFRRLAGKVGLALAKKKLDTYFGSLQVGVGKKNGADGIIHSINTLYRTGRLHQGRGILQVDNTNAFNLVSRAAIFRQVRAICPEILPLVEWLYAEQNPLLYLYTDSGEEHIESASGTQQGDPLGCALYALVQHILVVRIKEEAPDLDLNVWYLDDGSLEGTAADLQKVIALLQREGAPLGIHINLTKTVVWSPDPSFDFDLIPEGVRRESEGIVVLGAPIGTPEFIAAHVQSRIDEILFLYEEIMCLDEAHIQYFALRYCCLFPKFNFLLRVCDPVLIPVALRDLDAICWRAYKSLAGNAELSDLDMHRMGLRTALGGMCIPSASKRCLVAHLGSILDAHSLVSAILGDGYNPHLNATYDHLLSSFFVSANIPQANQVTSNHLITLKKGSQKCLSNLADVHETIQLVETLHSQNDRQRTLAFVASMGRNNSLWLDFIPHQGGGHKLLTTDEFRVAVKLRMGLPVFRSSFKCPLCRHTCDMHGMHALVCSGGSIADMSATIRHNNVVRTIGEAAKGTCHSVHYEPVGLFPRDPSARPADVCLGGYHGTTPAAVDVTIVPLGGALVVPPAGLLSACEGKAGNLFALLREMLVLADNSPFRHVEDEKTRKYGQGCKDNHLIFKVFGVGAFGGFNDAAVEVVRLIAAQRAIKDDRCPKTAARYIFTDISLVLQRAHATACLARGVKSGFMVF